MITAIAADLSVIDKTGAQKEKYNIAAEMLAVGRIDLFRLIMLATGDTRWSGLDNAETALNVISWLPDTPRYLATRIDAARLAITAKALTKEQGDRLWAGLKARAAQMRSQAMIIRLASAMIRAKQITKATQTISELSATDQSEAILLKNIISETMDSIDTASRQQLIGQLDALVRRNNFAYPGTNQDMIRIYMRANLGQRATEFTDNIPDRIQRLRLRQIMLEYAPPESGTKKPASPRGREGPRTAPGRNDPFRVNRGAGPRHPD